MAKDYPFINPIIISRKNEIIDGQYRFEVAKRNKNSIEVVYVDSIDDVKAIRRIQEEQRIKLEKWFIDNNVSVVDQLDFSSSNDKMKKFIDLQHLLKSDKEYWEMLSMCYQHSHNNYRYINDIKKFFKSNRAGITFLMDKSELKTLRNLPDKITIYRGMTVDEEKSGVFGISWSLNREIAIKCGDYWANFDSKKLEKTVKELEVSKEKIIAYFSGRKEEEIIYIH